MASDAGPDQEVEVLSQLPGCRVMAVNAGGVESFPVGELLCVRAVVPQAGGHGPAVVALVCGEWFRQPLCGQPCLRIGPGLYLLSAQEPGVTFHLRAQGADDTHIQSIEMVLAAFTAFKDRGTGALLVPGEPEAPAEARSATAVVAAPGAAAHGEGAPGQEGVVTAPGAITWADWSSVAGTAASYASFSKLQESLPSAADLAAALERARQAVPGSLDEASKALVAMRASLPGSEDVVAYVSAASGAVTSAAAYAYESAAWGAGAALSAGEVFAKKTAEAKAARFGATASPQAAPGDGKDAPAAQGGPADGGEAAVGGEEGGKKGAGPEEEHDWDGAAASLTEAGRWAAAGLLVGARYAGAGLRTAGALLEANVPACGPDGEVRVSDATMERIRSARAVTSSAVLVSRGAVIAIGGMARSIGEGLGSAARGSGATVTPAVAGAGRLGMAGLVALSDVWEGLEDGAKAVGSDLAGATEGVVGRAYGKHVAGATREGFAVGADAAAVVMDVRRLAPQTLAIRAGRAAADAGGAADAPAAARAAPAHVAGAAFA